MSGKTSATDILQPVCFEKWHLLQNKTKCNWPNFAYYYYWIENAIKWRKRNPNIAIEIYSPYGNIEQGAFIGICNSSLHLAIIFTSEPNDETLYKALTETKVIDWSRRIYLAAIHESIIPTIFSAVEFLKSIQIVETSISVAATFYFKTAEKCANVEICVPNECYIKPLENSDVAKIHFEWPHKEVEHPELSTRYIGTMVEMNGGIGLYLKKDDCLVSWAIHNDFHGIGMLQTLEEHTRKGYAKVVINALAKNLGEQGISPTLFIVNGNVTSETLFKHLDWERISPLRWVLITRKE